MERKQTKRKTKALKRAEKAIRELKAHGLIVEMNGRLYAIDGKPVTTVQ